MSRLFLNSKGKSKSHFQEGVAAPPPSLTGWSPCVAQHVLEL